MGMGKENYHKKCNRREDIISSDTVEEMRKKFSLKKNELAILMGLSDTQYRRCELKGGFLAFRFYAATDAIENAVLNKAMRDVAVLHKIKSGLKIEDLEL